MGDDRQQQGHTNAPPLPLPPPLVHPCVVVASHSIFSKLDTCFPYVRSSSLQDWLRLVFQLMKTDENCTELVDIGSVQFFEVLQPVRTGLGPGLVKI